MKPIEDLHSVLQVDFDANDQLSFVTLHPTGEWTPNIRFMLERGLCFVNAKLGQARSTMMTAAEISAELPQGPATIIERQMLGAISEIQQDMALAVMAGRRA